MRWTDRLFGLLSTLVLARLLVPADFGLVAMAMVIVGLLDALLDLGVSAALIQRTGAREDEFSTAWTLRLLQALVSASLLMLAAPWVADYYGDPRVEAIVRVVAVTVIVAGFENIGVVSFQKNMEFGRDFRFFFYKRVLGIAFTIAAALLLRSYWALVIGSLFSRVVSVGLSYWVSLFRPRLTLSRFRELWSFSQWKVVGGVAEYLYGSLDRLVVGRRSDAATMGAYTVGQEIATLPTTELLAPLGRVMFPAFSAAKHNLVELRRLVTLSLSVQALVAIPAGVGIVLVAPDAVPLLLGENWHAAIPFTQLLALAGLATALEHSSGYLLLAMGQIRTLSGFYWARLSALALGIWLLAPMYEAMGVAIAKVVTAFLGLVVLQALGWRALPGFGPAVVLVNVWRPVVAAGLMAAVVVAMTTAMASEAPILRLMAAVGAGAGTYAVTVLSLWKLARSPAGGETYLISKWPRAERMLRGSAGTSARE